MDLGVLERSPEAGDVEAVDGLVAGYLARAERFAARAVSVRAAGDGLVGASVGAWAAALGERSGRLASGWEDAAGGCRQVAGVLAGYGAALRGLERRVMAARHEVETARVRAVAARERYAVAALAGGVGAVPWSWTDVPAFAAVPQAAGELRVWRAAVADAAEGLRAFVVCCDEREDLDRRTAARLAGVEVMAAYAPGTGVDVIVDVPLVRALAASAAGTVTAAQRRVMATWFAQAAEQVSNYPGDVRTLAALTGFLDAWGDDGEVMSGVFVAIGGAGVVRLLTMLGEQMVVGATDRNSSLAAAGAALRSGLASASSTWSSGEAASYAGEMVRAASSMNGTLSAIGYAFADPQGARMSQTFTVAMADLLDAVERGNGGPWRDGPGAPGHALDTAGSLSLDAGAAHDAAARVFETLGAYPQAARDWLTGEGIDWSSSEIRPATPRITYWFRERSWAEGASDGFAGVGALWAGVQADAGDALVNRQTAAINTHVFHALAQNRSFLPTELTSAGAEQLANAISGQFAGLVEIGLKAGSSDGDISDPWRMTEIAYLSHEVPTAYVSRDWVVPVLTAAASDESGRLALQAGVLAYQRRTLEAVVDGSASAGTALDALATAWGAVDGASVSAAEVQQYLRDEQVRAGIETGRKAVDAGVALSPIRPMASIGVDVGLDFMQKYVESHMTGGPLPARSTESLIPDGAGSLNRFFEVSVLEYRRLGLWDKAGAHAGDVDTDDASEIADGLVGDYEDVVDAMRARGTDHVKGQ
ncbi:hypothetical protein H9657_01880 [Cellulomonas sp. Sa3CUA2]|uniref:WXG100 family type VII secretion target n=1 Tax=Cellulomonas avistercoris TaxID=2762242 RepID=A0ABR8Q9C5_9CELL|nr:hypothetical protein [Cellulomonas avistercoris]MBD7917031.1 hypothetical protein [Cellulomonas avistercoris]